MDGQSAVVIVDKAMLPEPIHEMTNPRPGCTDHLCQCFLIDSGKHSFSPVFLSKMCQQQENPSQTLLAVAKKLVDEILLKSDVAYEQMLGQQFRDTVLLV